jgi:Na+/H+ antiporter NhaC
MPIVAPLSYTFPIDAGLSPGLSNSIMIGSIGAVLAGSVLGDHASPISDTTIMSSMASGADHIDHVRTQIPYALSAGFLGLVIGYLPSGYGLSPLITLPVGIIGVILVVRFWGRPVGD